MNDATKTYINKVADAIRSTFGVAIPVDNIDSLVNQLGGRSGELFPCVHRCGN